MSSKLSPKKRDTAAKLKKSDMDFYRMSAIFFLLCAALLLILRVSTTITVRQATGQNMGYELYKLFRHPAYIVLVGALLIASIVWVIVCRVKKINEHERMFSSINALSLMLYVTGFSAFFGVRIVNNASSCMFALTATIVFALLYYISKIYHLDFLVFSIENALLTLFLYRYWPIYTTRGIVGKILLVVAFAAVGIAFVPYLKKCQTRPHHAEKGDAPLMFPYFVSLVIWTVFMFIKLPDILGEPLVHSDTMLTVMLVQYIVFAIVYTIKLIRE